jgi:adenylate cyclase
MTDLTAGQNGKTGQQNTAGPAAGDVTGGFRIDDWTVEPALTQISRDGNTTRLEPRVMAVLEYLAQRPGRLVSREELEQAVWAGTIVGYDALTGAVQKLRKAFNDDPRRPRIIETLSKKGYRLVAPVVPLPAPLQTATAAPPAGTPTRRKPAFRRPTGMVILLSLLLAAGGITYWYLSQLRMSPDAADMAAVSTIAVLPFDNLGHEPDQDYFTDGMTDELITGLARHPELLVIARDSAFMYRDSKMDTATIAQQLNVRYLLTGSVYRSGQQVRINAQLADSRNGSLLWADSYDGSLENIFELQDRITGRIVAELAAKIVTVHDGTRLRQTGSTEAYDSFLMGRKHFYLYYNREENQKARGLFEASIHYDPEFAMAYAMLAWTHVFDVMNGWSDDRQASLQRALELATRSLSLDKQLPLAYFVRGLAYRESGEYVKALVEAEKAIEYDPNYANAHILLATLLYFAGRPEEGLERILKAMEINPHHPFNYTFHLGQAYFILHRYREAVDTLRKAMESNPASERIHVWLAAALARTGALDDARWEATQVLVLNPEFSLQRMGQSLPFSNPADRQHVIDSLRMAGLS